MIHNNNSITLTALKKPEQCTPLSQGHTSITSEQGHALNKQVHTEKHTHRAVTLESVFIRDMSAHTPRWEL